MNLFITEVITYLEKYENNPVNMIDIKPLRVFLSNLAQVLPIKNPIDFQGQGQNGQVWK